MHLAVYSKVKSAQWVCGVAYCAMSALTPIASAKADSNGHVCFTPNSDRESEIPQKAMSALPPKADMCGATGDVRSGPIADIAALISGDE